MTAFVAVLLYLVSSVCLAQAPAQVRPQSLAAYPASEAAAPWRALAASYVRKALKDPVLNARVDKVMAAVGAAVAAVDPRFAKSSWTAILIEDFGHGAAAFPGETILVDAKFVRALQLNDDELALIFSHEAAHVVAGHAAAKLTYMAEFLGKEQIPTARTALLEFLAKDSYAYAFQHAARLQEREADNIGAGIFFATGYDVQRALGLFDKLAQLETGEDARSLASHDAATDRKQAIARVIADLQGRLARLGSEAR